MQLANQAAQRFNHEYIGTEHLLLGLVREGCGVGANVLKNLDIDLWKIRLEVDKCVHSGPDMLTMGKRPLTPKAKKVIEYSIEESRNLNHNYVGTEHLLLGLLREQEGIADHVLLSLGLKPEDVREEILAMLGPGNHPISDNVLLSLGLKPEDVREEILALLGRGNHPINSHWLTWNSATVAMIAREIKESKRWEDLPVLADALEEAGCADPGILSHCRAAGKHANRCWVVEILLRKP